MTGAMKEEKQLDGDSENAYLENPVKGEIFRNSDSRDNFPGAVVSFWNDCEKL